MNLYARPDQTILEEPSVLQTSAMEGSRTLDESMMPPPSSHRGQKRKAQEVQDNMSVSVTTITPHIPCYK